MVDMVDPFSIHKPFCPYLMMCPWEYHDLFKSTVYEDYNEPSRTMTEAKTTIICTLFCGQPQHL